MSSNQQIESERRVAERKPFSGSAEILDVGGGTRMTGRVADLSAEGCYVDTLNPLPADTPVRVKITWDGAVFAAAGTVRNCQPGMGMGLAFQDVENAEREILRSWLGDAAPPALSDAFAGDARPPSADRITRHLIEMLRKKQILTDHDVTALLRDKTGIL
jgi:hypothetical protein